ncbi:hypothetical protein AB6A40_004684 [Gnathostoma spinigerum]|uniref:Uncharacterized protein n=1 Tax=Gnathostoma spinigerum TaxID=75299 RepID=A0ABD6ED85_9BILA
MFSTFSYRYSQKSTVDASENWSNASSMGTRQSISYRGSEISVFISPQPIISINNEPCYARQTASWRGRPKLRISQNTLLDSSSEHNLSRYTNASSLTTTNYRNNGSLGNRNSRRPIARQHQQQWRGDSWNRSDNMSKHFSGLRESVA